MPQKLLLAAIVSAAFSTSALAQTKSTHKVEIAWNRFYDYPEIVEICRKLQAGYPDLVKLEFIGKSIEGRELPLLTVMNPKTGPAERKAAMWIDGVGWAPGVENPNSSRVVGKVGYGAVGGGTVTALHLLALEVPYRHLPTLDAGVATDAPRE